MKTEFLQLLTAFSDAHDNLEEKQDQYKDFRCTKHQLIALESFEIAQEILLSIFLEIRQNNDLIDELYKLSASVGVILKELEKGC